MSRHTRVRCTRVCVSRGDELMISREPLQQVFSCLTVSFTDSLVKSTEVRSLLKLSLDIVWIASKCMSALLIFPRMNKVIFLNYSVSSLVRLSRIWGRSSASIGSILCSAYFARSFARLRIHWSPRAFQACVARYRKSWARIGGVHVFLSLGRVTLVKIKVVGCWSNRKRSLRVNRCPNCKTIEPPHLRNLIISLNGLPRAQAAQSQWRKLVSQCNGNATFWLFIMTGSNLFAVHRMLQHSTIVANSSYWAGPLR